MTETSYKISTTNLFIEKLFTSPLKELSNGKSFNYDYIGEINQAGGIYQSFELNSDLNIYELLNNLSNYLNQILKYLNIPPEEKEE